MSGKERMRVLTDAGAIELPIATGSSEASDVGRHWNAVKQFLNTGDVKLLTPFMDRRIGDHRLASDPAWIEGWATRGELDFEDIYESGGA